MWRIRSLVLGGLLLLAGAPAEARTKFTWHLSLPAYALHMTGALPEIPTSTRTRIRWDQIRSNVDRFEVWANRGVQPFRYLRDTQAATVWFHGSLEPHDPGAFAQGTYDGAIDARPWVGARPGQRSWGRRRVDWQSLRSYLVKSYFRCRSTEARA